MADIETDIINSEESKKELTKKNNKVNKRNKTDENTNTEVRKPNIFLVLCIIGVSLGIGLEIVNVQKRNTNCVKEGSDNRLNRPKYWVYSAYNDVDSRNGLLKHVHLVLERIGYEKSTNQTPWELLWSHDYPFRSLYPNLHKLKPHQRVNHFPGTGFITNKVDLATTDSKYIPKAFKLPKSKKEFLKYANENPNALFLEKHNQHRGIFIKNVSEIDLSSGERFVQEYIQKPFLVDGHKFDIGVYVALTSINPLRAYWYKGDVLFRYCPSKYYPFDAKDLDKYVIGDDYLPTWEVPSLAHPYTALGYSMKEAFDIYVRSKGKDPEDMWDNVQKAIAEILVMKENLIIDALKNYPSSDNFFEMMRFDLILDEDLKVYLLEANMSPNLSSSHYPPNQLLYEQVLYNLFTLTGIRTWHDSEQRNKIQSMVSSQKNIAVWGDICSTDCKEQCDVTAVCSLCRHCLSAAMRNSLLRAHTEYIHRGDFRRLFPPAMVQNSYDEENLKNMSQANNTIPMVPRKMQCRCYMVYIIKI